MSPFWGQAGPPVFFFFFFFCDAGCCSSSSSCTSSCRAPRFLTNLSSPGFTSRHSRRHRCCRSCQARQSTTPPVVLLLPASAHCKVPNGQSSRFPLPEPCSAFSPRLGARVRGVPPPYHALSPPPPAPPLASGSVLHLRRAPTGLSRLFSSPQPFLMPTPALPLDSGLLLPVPSQRSLAPLFWPELHPSQFLAPHNRESGAPGFCTGFSVYAQSAPHSHRRRSFSS